MKAPQGSVHPSKTDRQATMQETILDQVVELLRETFKGALPGGGRT